MLEVLRTNQLQMELLAEMTRTLGKVAEIMIPSGVPEAQLGRYEEGWLIPSEDSDSGTC